MTDGIPAEVIEAAVTVCGSAFHLKQPLKALFVAKGVSASIWDRYDVAGNSKFVMARNVFMDLDGRNAEGRRTLLAVITELANMTKPHPSVENKSVGRATLAARGTARSPLGHRRTLWQTFTSPVS